uniref:Translation elongation factor 2 n=1 Tax=Neonothopanus gardneri TaxID=1069186 RepID=A0AB74UFE6_9AGAR
MLSLHLSYFPVSLLLLVAALALVSAAAPSLSQQQQQLLHDRLFQTNLRGPRWTGNENQNTLTTLVSRYMTLAGLEVDTLNYTFDRWDPRWWSLTLNLKNGTALGLPTTGYWPYSGNSGLEGVTAPVHDAGTFAVIDDLDPMGDPSSLNLDNLPKGGAVVFFDNPSPTRNYSLPLYHLLGTSRNISVDQIPELGNLSNPHWQSDKVLNFTDLHAKGVSAVIASWTHTSDEDAALQYLPNDGAPGDGNLFHVPALYVGNSTGEMIRQLTGDGEIDNATVTLYAPTIEAESHTVIGHLEGISGKNDTIIVYTHSDGPSIVEENGPILLLTMAETLARQRPSINIDFVITTGHMSGGHLSETKWMNQRPDIQENAKAAIVCEHFGALEFKDDFSTGVATYKATGKLEPMWTMANDSSASNLLHGLYLDAFQGTSDSLRMALLAPQMVDGVRAHWFGAGGSSTLGRSSIPTVGIIPQPDYLWAAMVDGGWSKLDIATAVEQIDVVLRLITSLDESFVAGKL